MKVIAQFAAVAAVVIGAAAAGLSLVFRGAGDRRALLLTAAVVYGVHLAVFVLARWLKRRHAWLAWGVGSVLRLVVLVAYAFAVVKVWMMPLVPSLIGCATFLFLPTLIEPLLLLK